MVDKDEKLDVEELDTIQEEDIDTHDNSAEIAEKIEKAESSEKVEQTEDAADDTDDVDSDDDDSNNADETDVSIAQIEELLSEKDTSHEALPANIKRMLARQAESSKRVEESIKGAKSNPGWFVPVFVVLLVLGLAWVVVNYVTGGLYPIPGIGSWNLLIGFGIMLVGFIMTMWWN